MAIVINGSGTVTGISVGGLPDVIVDSGTLATDAVTIAKLAATGTASSSTFLRGDNAWEAAGVGSGNVSNVFRFNVTDGGLYQNQSATPKVSFDAISFTTVSGRHYTIHSVIDCRPKKDTTGSAMHVTQNMRAFHGTTDRSQGDTTVDTRMDSTDYIGHTLIAAPSANVYGYFPYSFMGSFTAGASSTHYFYFTQAWNYDNTTSRTYSASPEAPWVTTIYEVLP